VADDPVALGVTSAIHRPLCSIAAVESKSESVSEESGGEDEDYGENGGFGNDVAEDDVNEFTYWSGFLITGTGYTLMTCAQRGRTRVSATTGGELKRCSGGCGGLARYCCVEHQSEHWAQHKTFCKARQRVADDPVALGVTSAIHRPLCSIAAVESKSESVSEESGGEDEDDGEGEGDDNDGAEDDVDEFDYWSHGIGKSHKQALVATIKRSGR
jgi:hypothetical protein